MNQQSIQNTKKNNNQTKTSYRFLPAKPINPIDDTFHGTKYLVDIEWWYFDAVFDDGYSIHIGFRIYHIKKIGILQTRINIYHHGKPIIKKIKRFLLSDVLINDTKPTIKINDQTVLSFSINDKQKRPWIYAINLGIDDVFVHLDFIGDTQGWKIETKSTCWTVPLPMATVKGTLSFQGKTKDVNGTGYHDHNWGYSPTTVMQNMGWFWGRITAETLHITWANTIASEIKQDLIAVVNKKYEPQGKKPFFTNVNQRNIIFRTKNYEQKNHFHIPHVFDINFTQKKDNNLKAVEANLLMKTIDIHYERIFIINYWRYHVETTGTITYDGHTETLNKKPQIIEYLRFKSS